jgi:NTE family protein
MKALVLSGGGLFGAYQAGAWSIVSEWLVPDVIVGVSVGAVNGWMIAAGDSPGALASRWLHPERPVVFPRQWPGRRRGLLDTTSMQESVRQTAGRTPRTPLALVATRCRDWQPVVFRSPGLDARHLLASCSIPLLFETVDIDGCHFCDGGMWGALPLWAAHELGASDIVGIHCLAGGVPPPMKQALRLLQACRRLPGPIPGARLRLISASRPLDPIRHALASRWDPARIRRYYDQGVTDAAAAAWRVPQTVW